MDFSFLRAFPDRSTIIKKICGFSHCCNLLAWNSHQIQIFFSKEREHQSSKNIVAPRWVNTAMRLSLFLNVLTTFPGNLIGGAFFVSVFGNDRLIRAFGPNLTFKVNPWHPRHACNFLGLALGIVAFSGHLFHCYRSQNCSSSFRYRIEKEEKPLQLEFSNIVLSRPSLHLTHFVFSQLFQRVLQGFKKSHN